MSRNRCWNGSKDLLIVEDVTFLRVNRRGRTDVEAIVDVRYRRNAVGNQERFCTLVAVPRRSNEARRGLRSRLIDAAITATRHDQGNARKNRIPRPAS